MSDNIEYIYNGHHWMRDNGQDDHLTLGAVVETVLCFFAGIVCLVAVMMLWLCG